MTRILPYMIYLWLVAMYQVFLGDVTAIFGVRLNLPVLLVLLVPLFKSEIASCWFGFLTGLVAMAGVDPVTGWNALVMAVIAFMAFHTKDKMNLESIYSKLIMVFLGGLIYNIVSLVMVRGDGVFILLGAKALAGAIYTTLAAWLFFLVKEDKITFRKFRAIF